VNDPGFIAIGDDRSRCTIFPGSGSIISWYVDGQSMLRATELGRFDPNAPLETASFPLVPYSNRIGRAQFRWAGSDHPLTPNFAPEVHAIHGVGWQRRWQVIETDATSCQLMLEHAADAHWPWPFVARQRFIVSGGRLRIDLAATNCATQPAPLGFGHHPYFDAVGASLRFRARHVLTNAPDGLPVAAEQPAGPFDFSAAAPVVGRTIDHCYSGWDGVAHISWAGRALALELRADLPAAVVYIPDGAAAFCFEPVPHVTNALNRPDLTPPMPIIQPNAEFAASIGFSAIRYKTP
jgi:aldose 1-epimerase